MSTKSINKTNFNPLVSIIVPIYKVETYIDACVNSIVQQSYTNLEIILVDDGSPDSCPQICDNYSKKDNRIKVIHKKNGGLSDARNAGAKIATGEWIMFIDSDDLIHPQTIEILMTSIQNSKSTIKLIACNYMEISDSWNMLTSLQSYHFDEFKNLFTEKKVIDYFSIKGWTTAWGKLYKKEVLTNMTYPVGKLHEDEFLTYKLLYKAGLISFIDLPLYLYRQRNTSIMANIKSKNLYDALEAHIERVEYFISVNELELALYSYRLLLSFYPCLFVKPRKKVANKQIKKLCKQSIIKYKNLVSSKKDKFRYFIKINFPRTVGYLGYLREKVV